MIFTGLYSDSDKTKGQNHNLISLCNSRHTTHPPTNIKLNKASNSIWDMTQRSMGMKTPFSSSTWRHFFTSNIHPPTPCWHVRSLRTVLVFALVTHSVTHSQSSKCLVNQTKGKRPCQFDVGKQGLNRASSRALDFSFHPTYPSLLKLRDF